MRVIAERHRKGDHPRYSDSSGYRAHWTCCAAVNAIGQHIGPAWIMAQKGAAINPLLRAKILANAPKGSVLWASQKGYINNTLFARYMVWFVSQIVPAATREKPAVLLLDGHGTRFQPELMRWVRDNHVRVIFCPPNSTAFIQVPDRTIFGPMKVSLTLLSFFSFPPFPHMLF